MHDWEFKICQVFILPNSFCEMASSMTIIIRPCSLHGKWNTIQYDPTAYIFFTIYEVEQREKKLQVAKKKRN